MVKKKIKQKAAPAAKEVKLYVTLGKEDREGFKPIKPVNLRDLKSGSVTEIQGQELLEKLSPADLVWFIQDCYRVIIPGGKCIFTAPHFTNVAAWRSPLTVRGISEQSLNFADAKWREQNKYTELGDIDCDFEVQGSFALEQSVVHRAEETRTFWTNRYNNVVQFVMFTLIKREK